MGVDLVVPPLGESITEAVVGKWNKKPGDPVKVDEPLVVLETDKVTVDVPAPQSGVLALVSRKEGEKVKVGEVLGSVNPGAAVTTSVSAPAAMVAATQAPPGAPTQTSQVTAAAEGRHATPVARKVAED